MELEHRTRATQGTGYKHFRYHGPPCSLAHHTVPMAEHFPQWCLHQSNSTGHVARRKLPGTGASSGVREQYGTRGTIYPHRPGSVMCVLVYLHRNGGDCVVLPEGRHRLLYTRRTASHGDNMNSVKSPVHDRRSVMSHCVGNFVNRNLSQATGAVENAGMPVTW